MREVICHYHIYKNSGTSFDHVLAHNFGARHISFDGPFPFFTIDQEQLDRIICRKTGVVAFSSHQIQLPAPSSLDYRVLSAVFIRHPILRIGSIYRFKRKSDDGTSTSRIARDRDFEGWLRHCFADRQELTHISNAQTRLLGAQVRSRPLARLGPDGMEYDLDVARCNLRGVTLLGRTEFFDADVERMARLLRVRGTEFNLPDHLSHNVTSEVAGPIEARIEALLSPLPDDLRDRLIAANRQDQSLFDLASDLVDNEEMRP